MIAPAHAGEAAALGTAVCFTFTALAFESAGRRVGSLSVNLIRLLMGLALLTALLGVRHGTPLPLDAPPGPATWLFVSGLVGFTFGDLCLFRAFVEIGARLSLLLMALVPPLTALLAWIGMGEGLGGRDLAGMGLTLAGIAWVILERRPRGRPELPAPSVRGILLGMGGALGQALGLILSKAGLAAVDPLPANQIRMAAGLLGFLVVFAVTRRFGRLVAAARHPQAMAFTLLGAFFGPFLGVTLSLFAMRDARAGVAATLMALTPVLILPIAVFVRREPVSARAAGGAALAVAGSALLFR